MLRSSLASRIKILSNPIALFGIQLQRTLLLKKLLLRRDQLSTREGKIWSANYYNTGDILTEKVSLQGQFYG